MDLIDEPRQGENAPEFSVSEISGAVKRTIEGEFAHVRVKGEVGRVMHARSGHLYFDIKDDRAVLGCTTWKAQVAKLAVIPEEGMEIVATGRLTTFPGQSKYQMNVQDVAVAGEGALMAMLEKRKKKLAAEGLFDPARKKPLPYLPEIIGVVTSPTGAVIRDILHRLRDRFPRKVLVWPVAVQGANSAAEVARAIEGFNAMTPGGALPRPDLLIVARGGGSIEDLWGFNEEVVARAAAASAIPLISAVGHETDTTLIDFVSDQRAPTPTAAAELAVPVRLELLAWTSEQGGRLNRALAAGVAQRQQRLRDLTRALPRVDRLTETASQRLDQASARLDGGLNAFVAQKQIVLGRIAGGLRPSALRGLLDRNGQRLGSVEHRLPSGLARQTDQARARLEAAISRLRVDAMTREIEAQRQSVSQLATRLDRCQLVQAANRRQRLAALDKLHETLGYKETLKRGYAVVRQGKDGDVITSKSVAQNTADLAIEFADGVLPLGAATRKAPAKPKQSPPEQGSLL
ncbi:exodeoxyribonuclease VII large subunit [Nereida sp. MMG025]|uniref:exodeoxyribonuclease VII large subunit n=1 Tax=Nereida sp. MMG025 TaxID=2909981 RepID=UPI001F02F7B8|nr:exodeoxyribonuclease VII large subunit [Nereida sp. MMG025]MCF6443808.1 exodeoxyribonuclease VII large subunit [Nereida sp. MMG025]